MAERWTADVVVVGSGPGGSLTACLLAEHGRDVLLIEEGAHRGLDSCPPFSRAEMTQKYRNGGLTVGLGASKIAYVEGCCVGGGSEINSGLYHRTPPEVLREWRQGFQVEALEEADLAAHFEACERELCVSPLPGAAPAASLKLREGADRLGWPAFEVPRWYRYQPTPDQPMAGVKQSMTQTFVPRFLAAGGDLKPNCRVRRLIPRGEGWELEAESTKEGGRPSPVSIRARQVFVAGGAIQTPALLRRSGLAPLAGRSLLMHPMIKAVAQFPEEVNAPGMGVPVHQVKGFAGGIGLGCSISSPPYLSLAMLDHPAQFQEVATNWRHMAVYYASTRGGRGSVRALPGCRDPLVRYALSPADWTELADALRQLCRCLLAAGATAVYPTVRNLPAVRSQADVDALPGILAGDRANLMTVHLFSSCPLGEDRRRCVADSFGRVHGLNNLWIADASLLPGPPGVNPQGSLMALARRNVLRFLEDDKVTR